VEMQAVTGPGPEGTNRRVRQRMARAQARQKSSGGEATGATMTIRRRIRTRPTNSSAGRLRVCARRLLWPFTWPFIPVQYTA
jgi:hypothetical protein